MQLPLKLDEEEPWPSHTSSSMQSSQIKSVKGNVLQALVVEVEGSNTTELTHLSHHHRPLLHAPGPFEGSLAEAQAVVRAREIRPSLRPQRKRWLTLVLQDKQLPFIAPVPAHVIREPVR